MLDPEKGIIVPYRREVISYDESRDWSRKPMTVVRQTNTILDLVAHDLPNLEPARDYLRDYTLGYLEDAGEGSDELFDPQGIIREDIDVEVREAAGHAFTVFGHLPDMTTSPFFPTGFIRRAGWLKAPETREQFLKRLRELKINIWRLAMREVEPGVIFESQAPLFRTVSFFKVGSELPIKLSDSERVQDQLEREKFNDFLGGMNVDI